MLQIEQYQYLSLSLSLSSMRGTYSKLGLGSVLLSSLLGVMNVILKKEKQSWKDGERESEGDSHNVIEEAYNKGMGYCGDHM